ncbi:cytochrome c oxidase subunit II [Halobacterium sp. R2-5]|uniref:cytochrome c oxidase subunit II n=1 Tax=Halobacterium sp. R2-5 TaxID=2715751 RepID=UPI00141F9E1E|nr:cytochrome c oxidase subunit II [Halobacterium sp. R2-5]NIB98023.1 cytochrome C oxidase subunit II [Halobacterium sp. R2-5]
MEIHRFERAWLVASLALIVAFVGTIVYGAVGAGVAMVDDGGGTVDASSPTDSPDFRDPGVYRTGDGEYDVYVVARQFQFSPGSGTPIRVPEGAEVTFHVASGDVTHGFNVVGTNLNTMVIPGQVAQLTVEFGDARTYHVACHEYCGAAHHDMTGTIEVVPQEDFDAEEVSEA